VKWQIFQSHGKRLLEAYPKKEKYADDRIPTLEELQRLVQYPDRRIKAIVYTMANGFFGIK
jgi:hypothetical protein